MQDPTIVVLIPYFGKWPAWFDLFLLSCEHNPSINWKFYTDCLLPDNVPANVSFQHMTFSEYKEIVSISLGISFNPRNPYKLCDIKPALGFIHQKDIIGYDFWGFSDIDLIYGDLRKYFSAEKLSQYDFFSTHARRVSGHFCLMRNTKKMRTAFINVKNWQKILSDSEHHAFDESAFSRIFIKRKNFPKPLYNLVGKLNPWRRRSEFAEAFSTPNAGVAWIDGSFNFPKKWCWNEGILTNDLTGEREYPYFHFYGWKKDVWSLEDCCLKVPKVVRSFIINKEGITVDESL